MFGLKPHPLYKNDMSSDVIIYKSSKYRISVQEFYKSVKSLKFYFWKIDKEFDVNVYTLKHTLTIPLSLHTFYISYIYPHLGKCHPDLRSKFYIGKPIEKRRKDSK